MRRYLTKTLVALTVLWLFMGTALAADPSTIEVGGLPFPPFIIADENTPPSGIMVELLNKAIGDTGKKVKFSISNWARIFKSAQDGDIDAIIPTMKSPDREEFLYFPVPFLVEFEQSLFAKSGAKIVFDGSMESLKPYRIGRLRNARVSPAFDKAREEGLLTTEERTDLALLIKGGQGNRLDLVSMDRIAGVWTARHLGMEKEVMPITPSLGKVPIYIAFSKKRVSEGYVQEFSAALERMKADGTVQAIIEKYIGTAN